MGRAVLCIVVNVFDIRASVHWFQLSPARCYGFSTTELWLYIINTFVVRCLNIKGTTPVLFPERRTCPFITKSKVSLNIILALFY